jgi:hypothetical protein
MMRHISTAFLALCVLSAAPQAQPKPDFSGIWVLDPARSDARVYGQLRVISQTSSQIDMTVFQVVSGLPRAESTGLSQTESRGQTSIIPWQLPFDRWRPRRGGDRSREPVVQTRWDGNRLVTVKAPGTHYSVLWIWSLSDDGTTMTVEGISTSISSSFDFKVASAPRGFVPDRHVYTRVTAADDPRFALGDALIRFGRDPGTIGLTCATASCTVTDVVAGRRQQSRALPNGREASLSLHANTLITAERV